MLASFKLGICYSQIAVYDPDIENPFNDWTQQHGAQGFTWRPGSVSFGMIGPFPDLIVEVWQADEITLRPETIRAILVPFVVGKSGVAVSGLDDLGKIVQIPEGKYALYFEIRFQSEDEYKNDPEYEEDYADLGLLPMWCRLTFIPRESVQAEILRSDSELSPSYPLLMEAQPVGLC